MTSLEVVSQVYATCEEEGAGFSFVCVYMCTCMHACVCVGWPKWKHIQIFTCGYIFASFHWPSCRQPTKNLNKIKTLETKQKVFPAAPLNYFSMWLYKCNISWNIFILGAYLYSWCGLLYPSQKVNNLHCRNNSLNNYGNDLMRKIMITFLAHLNNEII